MKHFAFFKNPFAFCFCFLCFISPFASSNIELNLEYIEQIYIIGTKQDVNDLPGSGTVISNGDLKKLVDTDCLLYTSPSPRDKRQSRMPSSA